MREDVSPPFLLKNEAKKKLVYSTPTPEAANRTQKNVKPD